MSWVPGGGGGGGGRVRVVGGSVTLAKGTRGMVSPCVVPLGPCAAWRGPGTPLCLLPGVLPCGAAVLRHVACLTVTNVEL